MNESKEPRYYAMDTDPRDGHPEIFGIADDAGIVDNEAGGVILYGSWDECVRIADILNREA